MQEHRAAAKLFGRFDRDDRVSECRETRRVASGARTDIENAARSRRDQVHDKTMLIGKGDALVALEQLRRLFCIILGAAHPGRSHRKPRTKLCASPLRYGPRRNQKPLTTMGDGSRLIASLNWRQVPDKKNRAVVPSGSSTA